MSAKATMLAASKMIKELKLKNKECDEKLAALQAKRGADTSGSGAEAGGGADAAPDLHDVLRGTAKARPPTAIESLLAGEEPQPPVASAGGVTHRTPPLADQNPWGSSGGRRRKKMRTRRRTKRGSRRNKSKIVRNKRRSRTRIRR
jgi:hypothetical protein